MTELEIAKRCADVMWEGDSASQALGIEIEVTEVGGAVARMTVRDDMVNGLDVCHGGLVFALGDTAFAFACNAYNVQSFAASCNIDFLRPALLNDVLVATASEDYRGRRSGYYTINIHNQREERVAIFRGRSGSNGKPMLVDQS
jgi:phenylacetic acid degradation protein PaaD